MFAYCGNNPIMFADPLGQAGKIITMFRNAIRRAFSDVYSNPSALPYVSADEAAEAFYEEIYAASAYIRHEFYAKIHVKYIKGIPTYGVSNIEQGATHSCYSLDRIPDNGMKVVAYVHTHPNENVFSPGDKEKAVDNKIDAYVVGPNLMMQRHSWQTNQTQSLYRISPTPLTTAQQEFLVSEFQERWDYHISIVSYPDDELEHGCECAEKVWPAW